MFDNTRRRFSRSVSQLVRAIAASSAVLAIGAAAVSGWCLITLGVRVLVSGPAGRAVWPFSIGLLLLSVCGIGFLSKIAWRGLWAVLRAARN